MTTTSSMPASPDSASHTMAGGMHSQATERTDERQSTEAGFDAALRARGGRTERMQASLSAHAESVPLLLADRKTAEDTLPFSASEEPPQGKVDEKIMDGEEQPLPLVILALGQSAFPSSLATHGLGRNAGKNVSGKKSPISSRLIDEPTRQKSVDETGDDSIFVRQKPFDTSPVTRTSLRILGYHQSRHFTASTRPPKAYETSQPASSDLGRQVVTDKALVDPSPFVAFSPEADVPLPVTDTEGLAGRILKLTRELSPPAVTSRQLDIAIAPPQGATLAVRLALRGDELLVTLRVPDAAMAERLQREIDHLAHRIGQVETHGATSVKVNVIVDPNAVSPAVRTEAAHGFMQPAHQQPTMAQPQGQQGHAASHMTGQGMGGHAGGEHGHGGAMQQEASPHRHTPLIEENVNGNGSESSHDPALDRQTPAGHRRLYI